jgi:hypothetical protein
MRDGRGIGGRKHPAATPARAGGANEAAPGTR